MLKRFAAISASGVCLVLILYARTGEGARQVISVVTEQGDRHGPRERAQERAIAAPPGPFVPPPPPPPSRPSPDIGAMSQPPSGQVKRVSSIPAPLLEAWSQEHVDDDWTAELSSYLLDAFSELEIDGEVVDVSCRSSLCRVQLEFASLSEAQRFSSEAHLAEQQKHVQLESSGGRPRVDALLTR